MFKSVHAYSQALMKYYKWLCKSGSFPDILKYADIKSVLKEGDTTDKCNRPITTPAYF